MKLEHVFLVAAASLIVLAISWGDANFGFWDISANVAAYAGAGILLLIYEAYYVIRRRNRLLNMDIAAIHVLTTLGLLSLFYWPLVDGDSTNFQVWMLLLFLSVQLLFISYFFYLISQKPEDDETIFPD